MQLITISAVANIHVKTKFIDSTQPQQNFEGAFWLIKDFIVDQQEHHYILPIDIHLVSVNLMAKK